MLEEALPVAAGVAMALLPALAFGGLAGARAFFLLAGEESGFFKVGRPLGRLRTAQTHTNPVAGITGRLPCRTQRLHGMLQHGRRATAWGQRQRS